MDEQRGAGRQREDKSTNWVAVGLAAASFALSAYVYYQQYKRASELQESIENVKGAVNKLGDYVTQINGDVYTANNAAHNVDKLRSDVKKVADYVAQVSGEVYALASANILN